MPLPQIDSVLGQLDSKDSAPRVGSHNDASMSGMSGASFEKRKLRDNEIVARLLSIVYIPLAVTVILLVVFGLVVCYSAVLNDPDYEFLRQLIGVASGFVVMLVFYVFDYRKIANMTWPFLIISVVLILSPHLPFIGRTVMGATSWIYIGTQIQPGEFAKVTVVLFAASLVARYGGKLDDLREYIKVVLLLLIPFVCILTQPDLGTGLVYIFIAAVVLVMGGARLRFLLITLAVLVALVAAIFALDELLKYETGDGEYEYRIIRQYQRSRLLVFLNQDSADYSDESYNLQQAMIAIGSGGLFGKGFGSSTQSALGFLPEAPTDFIFCVLAEEFGFVGVVVLIALYAALVVFSLRVARRADTLFGTLIVCAVVGMWLFQIMENIGMCCGLMPITGIPLPFMSYGSSFMVVNFMMLGLIGSVYCHRAGIGHGVRDVRGVRSKRGVGGGVQYANAD